MAKNIMTADKRNAIVELIRWYWKTVADKNVHISNSDYEFLYALWSNGVSIYDTGIQTRLNSIRDTYIEYHPSKEIPIEL